MGASASRKSDDVIAGKTILLVFKLADEGEFLFYRCCDVGWDT